MPKTAQSQLTLPADAHEKPLPLLNAGGMRVSSNDTAPFTYEEFLTLSEEHARELHQILDELDALRERSRSGDEMEAPVTGHAQNRGGWSRREQEQSLLDAYEGVLATFRKAFGEEEAISLDHRVRGQRVKNHP